MTLTIEEQAGVAIALVPAPSFTAAACADFLADLNQQLVSGRDLILDLAGVEFIDSAGLGSILSCLRRISVASGHLRLCNLSPMVRRMFEMVRMHRLLDIDETREDSLAALAND